VLAVCERGYGKRTPIEEFRTQNRGGKGIILIDCSDRNGPVVGIAMVKPEDEVMIITDRGQTIRTPIEGIRETGRNAQGVKLMSIADDERVVAIEPSARAKAARRSKVTPTATKSSDDDGSETAGDGLSTPPSDGSAAPSSTPETEGSDDGGQEDV